jgi:cytoskeleton protein RodZ
VPEPSAAPATVAAEKSPAFAGAGSQAAVAAENGPVPADAPGSDTTPDPETPATTARTPVAADPPPAPTGATRAAAIAEAPQIEAAAPTQVAAAPVAAAPDRPETARRVEPAVVGVTATTSPQPDEPVPAAPATAGVTGGEPASAETRMASLPPVPAIAPIEESAGRAYGLSNGDARVVLSASGDSWVQVRDANQNALLTRMLRAGDSYHVPNRSGLVMSVGNPSVLSVSIDDGPPFQLSSENVPISDIALDPEKLRDGTAIR